MPLRRQGGHFGEESLITISTDLGFASTFGSTFGSTARPSATLDARLEKRGPPPNKPASDSACRRENALTLTHCHMQILARADFDEICSDYAELAATLQQERDAQAREAREKKAAQKAAAEEASGGSHNNGSCVAHAPSNRYYRYYRYYRHHAPSNARALAFAR